MTDYISREAAKGAVCLSGVHMSQRIVICNMISAIPASDIRPVVSGEWVYEEPNSANSFNGCYWCDKCHQPNDRKKNFCPNCGADMRKVKKDND